MTLTFTATFGLMPGYGEYTYQPYHHDGRSRWLMT